MYQFDYEAPDSIEAAVAALRENDESKLVAGGMTLLPTMKLRLARPEVLIDINNIESLFGISELEESLVIGAMTRHADVAMSSIVQNFIPGLACLAESIGDPQVRNRGTIGGSVANNDSAADYPAGLVGLDATVVTDRREISADNFFTDMFETALEVDEIITAVRIPIPQRATYMKFPNPASRYAVVGVMIAEVSDGIRVAVTGASPCVFRATVLEEALEEDFTPEAIANIAIDGVQFNEDIHASAEFRAHLVKVMARRAVLAISS
ncbi:MAG: xanthine dehydrogenase family protein subunit M [Halieaceae bacterium]|nr:xanthine dehydrogenase family protein subunit M [Halieaceae bacterium]